MRGIASFEEALKKTKGMGRVRENTQGRKGGRTLERLRKNRRGTLISLAS